MRKFRVIFGVVFRAISIAGVQRPKSRFTANSPCTINYLADADARKPRLGLLLVLCGIGADEGHRQVV